jgi:hypothetical protein
VSRCHIHLPIINSAGDVFPYASVTLLDGETGGALGVDVFSQADGGNPIAFPLFTDPAVIDLWTDVAVRVQIVAEVSDNTRLVLYGIDILPPADNIVTSPIPIGITGADAIESTAVLMSAERGHAVFRTTDPVGTHEHEGDSSGSVVLTGEPPTDFNPYQSWIGYHAGENASPSSIGSSAIGGHATVYGASSTVMGIAEIVTHIATGVSGDMAVMLSSEDGTASAGSVVAGPANLTGQGRDMAVLGGLTGPTSPSSVPTGTVSIGAGNVIGAAGAVKIGPNHPTSTAGANHVAVGTGNVAQNNLLPWAAEQNPVALGQNIVLAGDPSNVASADDWFGGVGPLAMGKSDLSFSPSIVLLQGNTVTQMALRAQGDVVTNGQRTYSNTTTTLGFFGAVGDVRKKVSYDPNDYPHQLVTDVMQALSKMGLIYTNDVPQVYQGGHQADGTPVEFAETGQSLQWKLPPTSPAYRPLNDFTIASSKITLNAARSPFPTRGVPAIYSAALSDVTVQGKFVYNPTGTNAVTNPGFETDTSGWATWDSSTIARVTTRAKYGDACLQITPAGTGWAARTMYKVAVTPGQAVNVSAYVNPDSAVNCRLSLEWMNSGGTYLTGVPIYINDQMLPLNTWTRMSASTTAAPAGAAFALLVVGYYGSVVTPSSDKVYVDAAQIVVGSSALPPFVEPSGYHPDDLHTGLMIRCLHEKSIVGGQTIATPKGYLVGRRNVYAVAGNSITSTVATHSTPVATGQTLQADCSGTSVVIRANGTQISTFTDSTWTTRVKFGYRICESTQASDFLVLPFGF